jgi:integrase
MKKKPSIRIGSIYSRNGRYYFELKGKVKQTSLRTTDPLEAEHIAMRKFGHLIDRDAASWAALFGGDEENAYYDSLPPDPEEQKRVVPENSIVLSYSRIVNVYEKQMARVGVRHIHADATARQPLTERRKDAILSAVKGFEEWADENHPSVRYMSDVTPQIADGYFDHLRAVVTANSYNCYLSILRTVWKRLLIKGGMKENPFALIPRLSTAQVEAEKVSWKPFTDAEVQTILTNGDRWFPAACSISLQTGLRLGDVCTLKLSEVDLEGRWVVRTTRKSGKPVTLRMPELAYVKEWLESDERKAMDDTVHVFPQLAERYLSSRYSGISSQIHRWLRKLGIQTHDENGKTVKGFHSFRAKRATDLFAATSGNYQEVQAQLGHSSAATTAGYVHETVEDAKRRILAERAAQLDQIAASLKSLTPEEKSLLIERIK